MGDSWVDLAHGKKIRAWRGDQNRQKPALPQPKCLDVRHQGLVRKPWACCSNQAALLFLLGFSSQNRLILV